MTLTLRSPPAHWAPVCLAAVLCFALTACPEDDKRPLGATCAADDECASGLCLEQKCVTPDGDEDGDGLTNAIEGGLGTSVFAPDTDGDGHADGDEVGDVSAPANFDGDTRVDALERDDADADGDCLVDQRDPDDAAVADPSALADYGCCCAGRCSAEGATRAATCSAGALACTPPEVDRDGDGTADRCDEPAIALPPEAIVKSCEEACLDALQSCDGVPSDCATRCAELAQHEGLWLANYYCLASSCSEARCFGANTGFPEHADCEPACAHAEACGAFTMGTPVMPGTCRPYCAGAAQAGAASDVFSCLAALDAESCRPVDALACTVGDLLCTQACGRLDAAAAAGAPTAEHEPGACHPGSPIYATWADEAACLASCRPLSGFGQVAFLGCALAHGCADPGSACEASPDPGPPGCVAACSALRAKCPGSNFDEPSLCEAFCSGLTQAAPWANPTNAVPCLEALEACPPGEDGAPAALVQCVVGTEPRCATTCERFRECSSATPADCELGCTGLALAHPERIEPTFACLETATTCAEVPGCTPPSLDAVCNPACVHRLACNPSYLGGEAQCRLDCRADLEADEQHIAAWLCEATSVGCQTNCGALPVTAPPAACEAACKTVLGADTCIEVAYGVCPRACQGALAGTTSTSADCVVGELGRRCDPIAPKQCDPRLR